MADRRNVESSKSGNDEDSGVAVDEAVATEAANGSVANAVKTAGARTGETATRSPEEAVTGRSTERANADAGADADAKATVSTAAARPPTAELNAAADSAARKHDVVLAMAMLTWRDPAAARTALKKAVSDDAVAVAEGDHSVTAADSVTEHANSIPTRSLDEIQNIFYTTAPGSMANFSVESSESENDEDSGVAADEVVATEAAKGSANASKAAEATAGEYMV